MRRWNRPSGCACEMIDHDSGLAGLIQHSPERSSAVLRIFSDKHRHFVG
jgi:hypothetical protein